MIKKILPLLFIISFCFPAFSKEDYLYRKGIEFAKVGKASAKDVPLSALEHPYTISASQVEAMLLSIKVAKRYLLKKDVSSLEIFSPGEAKQFGSMIAEGLSKAANDEVVSFSVLHKRPIVVFRKDYVSVVYVYKTTQGVHFQFVKLYAALKGDYQEANNRTRAVLKAKSANITLEAGEGQKLSYDVKNEIILDPNFDFGGGVTTQEATEDAPVETTTETKTSKKDKKPVTPTTTTTPSSKGSTADRLKKLEQLKKDGLVTEKEYQDLRKKILSDL